MAARTRTAAVVPRVQSKAVVTLAALLVLTVPGAAIGATTAQPGQPLYGAKLGIERARVALVDAPEGNVAAHVGLAEQRLQELDRLRSTDPQVVAQVSQNLNDHADAANERLPTVGPSARGELTRRLSEVVATHVNVLDTLVGVGCPDSGTEACLALGETQDESVALHEKTTTTIVAAVSEPKDAPAQNGSEAVVEAIEPGGENRPAAEQPPTKTRGSAAGDQISNSATGGADPQSDKAAAEPAPEPESSTSPTPSATPSPEPSVSATPSPANDENKTSGTSGTNGASPPGREKAKSSSESPTEP